MKRLFLLIGLVFIVSGCDATYNLLITEAKINEEMFFTEKNKSLWSNPRKNGLVYKNQLNNAYSWPTGSFYDKQTTEYEPIRVEGFEYYTIEAINNNNEMGLKYSYSFNSSDYMDSTLFRLCFNHVNITEDGRERLITTSKGFNCYEKYDMLENVYVNITTDMEVTNNNADKVNGKTYTWEINKNNYTDKLIYIKYKYIPEKKVENTEKKQDKINTFWKDNWLPFVIILSVLSIIGLFVFNNINQKRINNNKL